MMADCEGRLTGKPGICFVTRGPGATNASAGIHIATAGFQPDDPVHRPGRARHAREREAFQEVDYRAFFGEIAKWVVEIDDAARIPELVTRAFAVATSGRPGPVVISLPEDMLTDLVEAPKPLAYTPVETQPGEPEMAKLQALLAKAKRPFVILGGTRWTEEAVAQMCSFAEALVAAGRLLLPPPDAVRPPPPQLCRRCRHRHQPEARRPTSRKPTSCCWSAAASAKCRRRTTRC